MRGRVLTISLAIFFLLQLLLLEVRGDDQEDDQKERCLKENRDWGEYKGNKYCLLSPDVADEKWAKARKDCLDEGRKWETFTIGNNFRYGCRASAKFGR